MQNRSSGTPQRVDVVEYGARRIFVTIAVILGALMEIIDTTIVNVALPDIQGNVGASQDEGTFIVTGYIVANVVVIPLSPWLQRRFGRKQYFFASVALFTFASFMCGLSHDLVSLVLWRIVQGAGGGGLLSQAQAILRETFPASQQGAAQAIFAVGAIMGPTIGPLLGGIITDNTSWEWCFFVNVPLGIAAATLTLLFLRNPEEPQKMPVDGFGLALLAIGLGSLQYVLDQGQEKDWFGDAWIVRLSLLAAISLTTFLAWELWYAKRPIVDLRVFRYPTVTAGCVLGFTLGVTLLGSLVTLPQYAQGPLGFTATLAGMLIAVRALPILIFTPLAARLIASGKIDPRLQIGFGFVCMGVSNIMLASVTTPTADFGTFTVSLIVAGVGLSQVFVPLSIVVFGSVAPQDVPKASAMFNLARQLGGSVATALLITLLDRQAALHQTQIASQMTERRAPVVAYLDRNGGTDSRSAIAGLTQIVQNQAQVLGYADTAFDSALVTFALAPFVLLMRKPKNVAGVGAE
jgi:DHA2 family multidrug resistance protein